MNVSMAFYDCSLVDMYGESSQLVNVIIYARGRIGEALHLSDDFIRTALPYANQVMLAKAGEHDGLFEKILADRNVPIVK